MTYNLISELAKSRESNSYMHHKAQKTLKKNISKISTESYNSILYLLEKSMGKIKKAEKKKFPKIDFDMFSANAVKESTFESIETQINKMCATVMRVAKKDQILIRRNARSKNYTLKKSLDELRSSFKKPEFFFTDRSGKKRNNQAYIKMIINNFVYSVARELVIEKAIQSKNEDNVYVKQTGKKISISEYEEDKDKIFHPNSKKTLFIKRK